MLTLFCLLFLLKGAKGGELALKIILMSIMVIIDVVIIMAIIAVGSGIHWLFS